jgi:phytanoyl-CoA hydroxylase
LDTLSYVGTPLEAPPSPREDRPYFTMRELAQAKAYMDVSGYVVVRSVARPGDCDALHAAFEREVKPYRGLLYRQPTGLPERHVVDSHGYMMNSLLWLQTLSPRRFGEFLERVWGLASGPRMRELAGHLLGEQMMILQTSYFEGNPETPPHQDGHFMDERIRATGIASWIALEDIRVGAGRLWVCPGTHRLAPCARGSAELYDSYLRRAMSKPSVSCRAPALAKGDVILWFSKTIHGSAPTTEPEYSRRSLVTHFVADRAVIAPPLTHPMRFRDGFRPVDFVTVNGTRIHRPVGIARARGHLPVMTKAMLAARSPRAERC